MPEGPSVRVFHQRVSPFVGQRVASAGGSTRKLEPAALQGLRLVETQVHGKILFLRFDPDEETGGQSAPEPLGPQAQREGPGGQEGPARCPGGTAGMWLQVRFGLFGSIRRNEFSRATQANKRGDWRDPTPRLLLRFVGGSFLTFYACQLTCCPGPMGTATSDILSQMFQRGQALEALRQARPVCYTLMEQRHFSGLGNIIKNEALYEARVHPLSLGSMLSRAQLEALLDQALAFSADWLRGKVEGHRQHTHIYQKVHCPDGHPVQREALGPPGGLKRLTWWCPQCQPQVSLEEQGQQQAF
ncbi:endonuclease 8-like 2 [Sorex araneus]|uniref:endonuclease 8-like 2 n=1 Tax=Sorex araneus TaxID=42254 RepID=UPI0024338FC5|nr:endonuclease 8-like 2 [Sorex araneus]